MTDRLSDAHRRIADAASRLHARALDDLSAAAYPSAGDGPHVSSSSTSRPTEQAGINGQLARARDHQLATRLLEQAAALLERGEERMTPLATGEPCPSVARDADGTVVARCQGTVTHHGTGRGLCEECDADWRSRRGLDIPPEVLQARNARRKHPCTCHDTTCGHDPGGCLGLLPAGELTGRCEQCACTCGPDCCPDGCSDPRAAGRTVSERCKKRQDRSTVGTGGAFAWQDRPDQ